jgi:hypothetical protein
MRIFTDVLKRNKKRKGASCFRSDEFVRRRHLNGCEAKAKDLISLTVVCVWMKIKRCWVVRGV